jgi:hypothetical protein
MTIKIVETAATTGLISYFREVKIWTGRVTLFPVVRNRAIINSPKELMKAKKAPTTIPV